MAELMKIVFSMPPACCLLAVVATALLLAAEPVHAQTRRLAPGVLTTITPQPQEEELYTGPQPLTEVPIAIPGLEYTPNLRAKTRTLLEQSKGTTLRRTIWNLEFSFKPMRMIEVEIPQANARMQRKLIWYMVYRVRNLGGHWRSLEKEEIFKEGLKHITYGKEVTNQVTLFNQQTESLRFMPHFVLASLEFQKEYLDRVIPAAIGPIRTREFPGDTTTRLYDSQQITEVPIPISTPTADKSIWGVVTWEDVDPRIDYFSVYVQGLTNAYKFVDAPGGFKAGDKPGTGRQIAQKTLRLNFWRPGDTIAEDEGEIRYGMRIDSDPAEQDKIFKLYGTKTHLDYEWVYR
jgi:hypothetical protein